jgi:hypothetical protein
MAETAVGEGSMTVPLLPTTTPSASANGAACSVPECLQKRAPVRIEITDSSGRALRMAHRQHRHTKRQCKRQITRASRL